MADHTEEFKRILKSNRIPILVLDQKWHRLFEINEKPEQIRKTEARLNEHLAAQGRFNTELRELKRAKSQLMESIIQNMEDPEDEKKKKIHRKKMKESTRLMDELNGKIAQCEDELLELPDRIQQTNEELMFLSLNFFYDKIQTNLKESQEIGEWIDNVRIELKKNVVRKQNRDISNRKIYAYLHDIFGAEVLDRFDIQKKRNGE